MNKPEFDTPLDKAFTVSRTPVEFARRYGDEIAHMLRRTDLAQIGKFIAVLDDARRMERTLFFAGNGGKAALCEEWVNDLTVALPDHPFRAFSLMSNVAALTAAANDYSYESALWQIFKPMAEPGDVLVCLSGTGWSDNIMYLAQRAKPMLKVIGIGRGGALAGLVDLHVEIPAKDDGPTEDGIMILLHMCHAWFVRRSE